jgi:hypothetical protein
MSNAYYNPEDFGLRIIGDAAQSIDGDCGALMVKVLDASRYVGGAS